jgi:hypothetical protein
VALSGGLQAQDYAAGRLGVRARCEGLTDADVLAAAGTERSVVRTWLMRNTLHLVASADVRWLARIFGPVTERRFASRWRALGLTDRLLSRTADALLDILSGAALTRSEISARLSACGIEVPADPQAITHILLHATTQFLVCRAADRGSDATFVLLEDWLPEGEHGPDGDDALAELARRYFQAFSPATGSDFTAWSGLPSGRALAIIRDELTPAIVEGRPGFRRGTVAPARGVRLLPAFDNYLVGYRHRAAIIDAAHRPTVYVGGVIKPAVLVDGQVRGIWRVVRARQRASVEVTLFDSQNCLARPALRRALEAEASDIARFLGLGAELVMR